MRSMYRCTEPNTQEFIVCGECLEDAKEFDSYHEGAFAEMQGDDIPECDECGYRQSAVAFHQSIQDGFGGRL